MSKIGKKVYVTLHPNRNNRFKLVLFVYIMVTPQNYYETTKYSMILTYRCYLLTRVQSIDIQQANQGLWFSL